MEALGRKSTVAWLSVVSNTSLVLLKLAVGLLIGSVAVMSEAIHSGLDLVASVIALFAVRRSDRPADEEHPFGHGKVENLSGAVEALLIFAAAGWIAVEAVRRLIHAEPLEAAGWGVLVMLLSSLVNLGVSHLLFKVGRKTESVALQADGWHLRTDVYTSAGVMAGLVLIWVGHRVLPGSNRAWLDPVAALAVALLILRAAYSLTVHAGRDLLDTALPAEQLWIREYIAGLAPTVRGYHKLRTRRAGNVRFVDVHLFARADLTLEEAHGISDRVERAIGERFPGSNVTVHMEPCDGVCGPACADDCLLEDDARAALRDSRR
ncbi:MAG: cation diffusion facilitator family transporter [Actinobacteria bacterium]|nr:cation diffusion facilitator family transporter [Actinomycetota bacterium]